MSEPQGNDRTSLQQLLSKLVDGTLADSELLLLQERLKDNPVEQEAYFHYLDLDTDLRQMTHESASRRSTSASAGVPAATKFLIASIAASLMAILAGWWAMGTDDVVLVQSFGARFFRDTVPAIGQPMKYHHPYALTEGMIELRFASGAEVILDAPAAIEIVDPECLVVQQGSCSVHAPPGAEGFQVLTPEAEVIDLGTRFSVSVSESGDTEIQVVEGAAEVRHRHRDSSKKVLLEERQASRLDADDLLTIDFTPGQYRRDLPDRLVGFQVGKLDGIPNGQLESVLVQRSGITYTYPIEELIGIEITHFRGGANTHCLSVTAGDLNVDAADRRDVLESDSLLQTGALNLGGSHLPLSGDPILIGDDPALATPGMAVRFRQPVINHPGPDVLFFELQCALNPPEGDAFHVSPLRFEAGLCSSTVRRYDISLDSSDAQPMPDFDLLQFRSPVGSLEALLNNDFDRRTQTMPFYAIGVGIDLSDLGYPNDAAVDGMFFQDASEPMDDDHVVDPVWIGGLPPLKEQTK